MSQKRTLTLGVSVFGNVRRARQACARRLRALCTEAGRYAHQVSADALEWAKKHDEGWPIGRSVRRFYNYLKAEHGSVSGSNLHECARLTAMAANKANWAHRDKVTAVRDFLRSGKPEYLAEFLLGRAPGPLVRHVAWKFNVESSWVRDFVTHLARRIPFLPQLAVEIEDWNAVLEQKLQKTSELERELRESSADEAKEVWERKVAGTAARNVARFAEMLRKTWALVEPEFLTTRVVSRESVKDLYARLRQLEEFYGTDGRRKARQVVYSLCAEALVSVHGESLPFFANLIDPKDLIGHSWKRGARSLPLDLTPTKHEHVVWRPKDLKGAFLDPQAHVPPKAAKLLPQGLELEAPVFYLPGRHKDEKFAIVLRKSHGLDSILAQGPDTWEVKPGNVRVLVPSRDTGKIKIQVTFSVSLPEPEEEPEGELPAGWDINRMGRYSAVGAAGTASPHEIPIRTADTSLFEAHRRHMERVRMQMATLQEKISNQKRELIVAKLSDHQAAALRRKKERLEREVRLLHERTKHIKHEHDVRVADVVFRGSTSVGATVAKMEHLSGLRTQDRRGRGALTVRDMPKGRHVVETVNRKFARAGSPTRVAFVDARRTSTDCPGCGRAVTRDGDAYTCECGRSGNVHVMAAINIAKKPIIRQKSTRRASRLTGARTRRSPRAATTPVVAG